MPPNVRPLRRRACAYDESVQATENTTAALAPRVALLTSNSAARATITNVNTYFHLISGTSECRGHGCSPATVTVACFVWSV